MKIGGGLSAKIADHAGLTATHGVSGSIADADTLTTHEAAKTGVHGVGSKYIALATDSTQKVANADIKALAGIAYSKLALAGLVRNTDIKSDAAIAYAKLNLTGAVLAADIVAAAAIPLSKLVSTVCSETEADDKIAAYLGVKVKVESRVLTAEAGNVAYTGYGFQPTGLIVIAFGSASRASIGMSEPARDAYCAYYAYTAAVTSWADTLIEIHDGTGHEQTAIVASYDADGFTLTWAKSGTPTITVAMIVVAIK